MLAQFKLKTYSFTKFDKKYRDGFEIVASILEVAKDGYTTKFSIAKYAKANYAQLNKYLQFLVKMCFIEAHVVDGRVFYKTSVKGIIFLKHYSALLDLISDLRETGECDDIVKAQFATEVTRKN
ncbi:MAG: winged helix-turn-helix domain-containing protein [Candidatus Bathyarchaeales archaeon]